MNFQLHSPGDILKLKQAEHTEHFFATINYFVLCRGAEEGNQGTT